ncbi:MAG: RNA methyltransferase [Halieaceae bacterium]|jgi:23S rRNA (guanosine2251-2'-O)-methyltransferase|nr:RNA methyltransferase [Halieaceae bacterium]
MAGFFDQVITVYGRKPVLEILRDDSLPCQRLHLADSNKPAPILEEMRTLAARRGIEVVLHGKRELSRISRKGSQDQGVALDVHCPAFRSLDDFLAVSPSAAPRVLAIDGVTNPQNVGMLVRSAVAGGIDAILWPRQGNAALGPLAVKASAGTLFRAPLVRCRELSDALLACRSSGYRVCVLDGNAERSLFDMSLEEPTVFVLGNETEGPSAAVKAVADVQCAIPMANRVESLNVAVTAALVAFLAR